MNKPTCHGRWGVIRCDCARPLECASRRYTWIQAEYLAELPTDADRRRELDTMRLKSKAQAEAVRDLTWKILRGEAA